MNHWQAFARAAVLLPLTMAGCNAVLGIEPAEEKAATAPVSVTTLPQVQRQCTTVTTSCSDCVKAKCADDLTSCLATKTCRGTISDYLQCLGKDCKDDDPKTNCAETVLSGTSDVQQVQGCLADPARCGVACAQSAVVTACELYCACMANNCSTYLADGSCMKTCTDLNSLADQDCRYRHCEFAAYGEASQLLHCPHAIGKPDICNVVPAPMHHVCLTAQESGYPCSKGTDCCSGKCNSSSSVCD